MKRRLPLLVSVLMFVALCASGTYWALQLMTPPQRPVAPVSQAIKSDVSLDVAASLFGGRMAKVALASNYQLRGVVVASNANESVAILGADGKPTQASRVNAEVVPGVTVKEVHGQYVLLSEGGMIKRVELQEIAKSTMQLQPSAVPPQMSQPPARMEVVPPPPLPARVAPAQPTTMVLPAQTPMAPIPPGTVNGQSPTNQQAPNQPPNQQPQNQQVPNQQLQIQQPQIQQPQIQQPQNQNQNQNQNQQPPTQAPSPRQN
jgi:general secretion pathway protein C